MTSNDTILKRLRENPGPHLRAIEELTKFADRTKIFVSNTEDPKRFAYLMISGHPSTIGRSPTVIIGGHVESAKELSKHLPTGPYTVLETNRDLLPAFEAAIPKDAKIYSERRMELRRAAFKPAPSHARARRLNEGDDVDLAEFNGLPAPAAAGMRGWIKGAAAIFGIFENSKLQAMGSTFCNGPDGWSLVSIKTREDARRKGLAHEVTSALCATALEKSDRVDLTVLSDNAPAIALYEKLGFELKEHRVWIDCGSGSKPFV